MRPRRSSDGWDQFDGDALAETPAVRAALARAPQTFLAIVFEADDIESEAIPRAELCSYLSVATRDGTWWGLGLEDTAKVVVDLDQDDLKRALAGQPDVAEAEHEERETFQVVLARQLTADEVLARFVDAIAAAHREQARQRGITVAE
ncbi:hypothetical protein AB0J74_31665 [Asanoa sp. NPDC049573]|uniref:hypothetical protein n=1 Tax=Asanoa sp. NPDC049573 TaxID=3155396 RepID=UPI0034134BF1